MGSGEQVTYRLERSGTALDLFGNPCGVCEVCRRGLPLGCVAPLSSSRLLRSQRVAVGARLRLEVLLVGDLVRTSGAPGPTVKVQGGDGALRQEAIWWLQRTWARYASDSDQRELWASAGSPSRPDIVIDLDGDLSAAARSVRRGGAIGAPLPVRQTPTTTVMVQRELDVLTGADPALTLSAMAGAIMDQPDSAPRTP